MTTRYLTKDLKEEIDEHDKRIWTLEKNDAVQDVRIKKNCTAVNDVKSKADELENVLIAASLSIKIGTWIVAGFGVSVIALIWSLITGQAVINFK